MDKIENENNQWKEHFLAGLDKATFDKLTANLPTNYDAMMDAISKLPASVAIGEPTKILERPADPTKGLGEAGLLFFDKGEGVKQHTHTADRETYTFADGRQATCNVGESHEITPSEEQQIVAFDKRMDDGREM